MSCMAEHEEAGLATAIVHEILFRWQSAWSSPWHGHRRLFALAVALKLTPGCSASPVSSFALQTFFLCLIEGIFDY